MKKLLSILLLGAMLVGTLASCDSGDKDDATNATTTTKAPTTTTKGNQPEQTTAGTLGTDAGDTTKETPMALAEVETWMAEHTMINDLIDPERFICSGVGMFADGGLSNLFDWVFNQDDWNKMQAVDPETGTTPQQDATHKDWVDTNGSGIVGDSYDSDGDGVEEEDNWIALGKFGYSGSTGTFIWGMKEPVTLGSYVIYTGNDNASYPGRNPVGWKIYATNDEALAAIPDDRIPYTWVSTTVPTVAVDMDDAGWVLLDDVYDGNMDDANFTPFGYKIDADKQGEYKYYAWHIEFGGAANLVQCTGMKLFAA